MTVNLEKELRRQAAKIHTPKELLAIREYDKLSVDNHEDELKRVFGKDLPVFEGKSIVFKNSIEKRQAARFNPENVFHVSQIKDLCHKYALRFLPTDRFKGSIDSETPGKIAQFEIAYDVQCSNRNMRIAAPSESFELEEKPKDPLLFYQINEQYYYLVHKWGSDISITRRLISVLSNEVFTFVTTLFISVGLFLFFLNLTIKNSTADDVSGWAVLVVVIPVLTIFYAIHFCVYDKGDRFKFYRYNKDNWNSTWR